MVSYGSSVEIDMPTNNIAVLTSEMDSIHLANRLFWAGGESVTIAARAEYKRRQERLEQIRVELVQLRES
jgi:hypothetical protein